MRRARGNATNGFALLAILCLAVVSAHAQEYPSKPIRWIVPFGPGGSGDAIARVLGESLTESLGQRVVVENRPGGNTIVAAVAVEGAAPDGYTLLEAVDSTITMLPSVYDTLPYRVEGFTPVAMLVEQSLLFATNPKNLPAKTVAEFVSYAKAHPGKVNVGVGSIFSQLIAEILKTQMGIDVVIIPFKGGAESSKALLAGTVDATVGDITSLLQHIRSDRVHALATTRIRRASSLPDVPTLSESGYKLNFRSWFGLLAPAGTPAPVVLKLNHEINKALTSAKVKERLATFGLDPTPGTPEEFSKTIEEESKRWSVVIKEKGIKPQ